MSKISAAATAAPLADDGKPASQFRQALAGFRRDRAAVAGAVILVLVVLAAVLAPLIAPYSPTSGDQSAVLAPPLTGGHLLGTDDQGRDILARIIYGSRLALPEAIIPVLAASVAGTLLGLAAGFYGRWLGETIMRVLDIFFAVPMVLLGVAIAAALGTGAPTVIISMAIVITPYIGRVAYTSTTQLRNALFVDAARCAGARQRRILGGEILPHVVPTVLVYATTNMGAMVVFAAGFGFLGLGAQPPTPDWGAMIAEGSSVPSAPWLAAAPGIVIIVVAVAFNYLGDGLRIAMDPRLRTRR